MSLEIKATLLYKTFTDKREDITLYLGDDGNIYEADNPPATQDPYSSLAQFKIYENDVERINRIFRFSNITYKDGSTWHSHGRDGK